MPTISFTANLRRHVEIQRAPSVFGFAVAAHPTNPDVAWFAPAVKDEMRVPVDGRLVVSKTNDGVWISEDSGEHWITAAPNLPPIHFTRFV